MKSPQLLLFGEPTGGTSINDAASTTFTGNLRLPVHRWIRFSAGFSGAWAQHVIEQAARQGETRVFDPFAGSGTTLITAENAATPSYGVESHPFVYRLARAKLARRSSADAFQKLVRSISASVTKQRADTVDYPKLIHACYSEEVLLELDRLRRAIYEVYDNSDAARLLWLALVAILRSCSHAGTAQWQYVLPRKVKKTPAHPLSAFQKQARMMLADMAFSPVDDSPHATLLKTDARECIGVPDCFATLVITSPPYPNNYDYADATRLEMCFLQEIAGWGDLQSTVRRHLVRSCTQHVPERAVNLEAVIADPALQPIRTELSDVCEQLARASDFDRAMDRVGVPGMAERFFEDNFLLIGRAGQEGIH